MSIAIKSQYYCLVVTSLKHKKKMSGEIWQQWHVKNNNGTAIHIQKERTMGKFARMLFEHFKNWWTILWCMQLLNFFFSVVEITIVREEFILSTINFGRKGWFLIWIEAAFCLLLFFFLGKPKENQWIRSRYKEQTATTKLNRCIDFLMRLLLGHKQRIKQYHTNQIPVIVHSPCTKAPEYRCTSD